MARILILLAGLAITLAVIGSGAPGIAPLADGTAAPITPASPTLFPSLDPLSLGIGAFAGLVIGWIWALPWRNMRELSREIFVRSLRGFGIVGVAMVAAAILLFY